MDILQSEGYKKLLKAVEEDESHEASKRGMGHDYRGKLNWVIERAMMYEKATGLDAAEILNSWEKDRSYWYMNYYQDCNQPKITTTKGKVFDTQEELLKSIGKSGFRCPMCKGISKSPYECTTGLEMPKGKVCDWKVYGLFRDLGKGVFIFSKEKMRGETIFMPVAWEV